jgi:hypothetical protein
MDMNQAEVHPAVPVNPLDQMANVLAALTAAQQQTHQQIAALLQVQQQQQAAAVVMPQPPAAVQVPAPAAAQAQLNKNVKLTAYHGERDAANLDAWVFQMEEYFNSMSTPVSEAEKIRFAGINLKGQAALWWLDVGKSAQRPATWNAFVAALQHMFTPLNRAKIARDQLANARQGDREPVARYTAFMRRLILSIPTMAEDEKLDRYIRGLSPAIREKVFEQEPTTFEQAAQLAAKYELLLKGKGRGVFSTTRREYYSASDGNRSHAPMEIDAMESSKKGHDDKPPTKNGERRPVICFNCGKEGHMIRDCPEPKHPRRFNYQRGANHPKGRWRRQGYRRQ